ncbi:uncharacterized protein BDW47DRAFT_124266 [Aspergillus candidus]|uniref:Uncharacterized protein n=1 Tax=Aspergillus candidus TaxID=41067 RepID=A0A2I2FG16_ASPCN|nr:hypothetical protein BDW47DRAFT_124266 [Aspergillus candidus]PLB39575.1 hypothetical protein BDW47DRAFT_124266 [Aspergillus candidus]
MQLTNILLAFMASAVVVMAAPAAEVNENNAAAWKRVMEVTARWQAQTAIAEPEAARNKAALEMEQSAGALVFLTLPWIALAAGDEKSFFLGNPL